MGMGAGLAHIRGLVYRPASLSVQRRWSKKGPLICIFPRGQGEGGLGDIYILCVILYQKCVISGLWECQGYVRGVEWGGLRRGPPSVSSPADGGRGIRGHLYILCASFWDISSLGACSVRPWQSGSV